MDRSLANLLVGRTLGNRYRIEDVIGRGGMSVVFRGVDERLGRSVAVKVMSLPALDPEEQADLRERLRREAASAASIPPHPNVVQVYDHGSDDELGVDFIAMELLPGRDLKSMLGQGMPPLDTALRMLREASAGVAAGHRAGIVHRDVKPSNIVIAEDGSAEPTIKILDFGIAKALDCTADDDLTRTGQLPHSPAYASPEQLRHESTLTPASDVYQLGLVAYELLTGERAFSRDEHERMRQGEDLRVPERGGWLALPAEVREIVGRALAPTPEHRFQNAGELCAALASLADDATILLAPSHPTGTHPGTPLSSAPDPALAPAGSKGTFPRAGLLGIAAIVALLLIWVMARGAGDEEAAAVPPITDETTESMDEEFRTLQVQAAQNLAAAGVATGGDPSGGEEDAAAVDAIVQDINRAWADGDMERLVSHYAERVDFYGSSLTREQVQRSRGETIVTYPQRTIELLRTAITFPASGVARVLVDKEWDFRGDGRQWEGSARQEMVLREADGRWRVTEERELELYNQELN